MKETKGTVERHTPPDAFQASLKRRLVLYSVGLALASLVLLLFLVAPVAAQDPTPEPEVYTVQPGDTLFAIAQRLSLIHI